MLKKLLVMLFTTLFAFATQAPKIPKMVLDKSLEQLTSKGMAVENRKTTDTTDSFELVVKDMNKLAGMPQQNAVQGDKNASAPTTADDMQVFNGIALQVDVNYTKDAYHTVLYLSKFPMEGLSKDEKAVLERVINKQLIHITSDFNINTNKYTLAFKDIDEKFDTINVKASGIQANGTYDIDNLDTQDVKFNMATLMLTPTEKKFLGEYLTVNNAYINVDSAPKDKMLDIRYNLGVELIDANISKKVSKVNKANFDIKVSNLDRASYNKLIELSQSKTPIDPNSPEFMNIVTSLITPNIVLEIKDLSLGDLIADGNKMGGMKASAKASLKKDPNVAQLIKMNPMMALSALEVEANIELSQEMLKAISQTPKGAMLAFIPPKMENGVAKYVIKYAEGKLLVNGKPLQ